MIKHRLLTFLSIMAMALFTTACFDESGLEIVYDGPSVIEWDRASTGSAGTYLAGAGQTPTETIQVNLIGPQRDQPTQVQWRINQEESTAIENVHYIVLSDQNITIPANSSTAAVEIQILTDNFESPDDRQTLVLELVGGDLPVAANYGTLVHNLSITCPSELEGTYTSEQNGVAQTRTGPVNFTYNSEVELTEIEPGLYTIDDMTFGLYPQGFGLPAQSGTMQDVCNEVSMVDSQDEYGGTFTGTGQVNDDGTIEFTWESSWGDTGTTILTPKN